MYKLNREERIWNAVIMIAFIISLCFVVFAASKATEKLQPIFHAAERSARGK